MQHMQPTTMLDEKEELGVTQREMIVQQANILVTESGQGRPILLLHGAPDTHAMWLPVMALLNKSARCIAIDLPGFGASTLPSDFSLSLDHMADFIHDLLTALRVSEPVTLLTTDFGGHYGMAFLVKYPQLVRGIVISNTNFFHDYQWHFFARLYRIPILGELLLAGMNRSLVQKTLKQYAPNFPDAYITRSYTAGFGSPAVRQTILRMYRARNSQDFIGWEDKLIAQFNTTPAIVLWGDKDPFITPNFADRFGQAKVHHFPTYSHWLPLEAPQAYMDALQPWLAKLE